MKNMRHRVNVMRPTKAEGTLGELQGQPELYRSEVPCSIKPISGNESEQARQNAPSATFEIEMYGDPNKPTTEECWLELLPLTKPPRKFNIQFIDDKNLNQIELRLLCGE